MNPQDQQPNPQQDNVFSPTQPAQPTVFGPTASPQLAPQQPFQPTTPQAPLTPVQNYTPPSSPAIDVPYESNPFYSMLNGLTTMFKTNKKSSLLSSLAFLLIIIGAYFFLITSAIVISATGEGIASAVGASLAVFIGLGAVITVLSGMMYAIASASVNGEEISTSQALGRGIKKLPTLIIASILGSIIIGIGLLLLIIPGLYLFGRVSLTGMAIFHENLGPIAAIKRSMELTKGRVIEMLGAFIGSYFLSGGSSGLLALPLAIVPFMSRYHESLMVQTGTVTKPKTHWMNYLLVLLVPLIIGLFILLVATAPTDDTSFGSESVNETIPIDGSIGETESDFEFSEGDFDIDSQDVSDPSLQ